MAKRVIIAGLLGGVVLIAWTFAVNGLLGFKSSMDMNRIPAERQVYEVLKTSITEPGSPEDKHHRTWQVYLQPGTVHTRRLPGCGSGLQHSIKWDGPRICRKAGSFSDSFLFPPPDYRCLDAVAYLQADYLELSPESTLLHGIRPAVRLIR